MRRLFILDVKRKRSAREERKLYVESLALQCSSTEPQRSYHTLRHQIPKPRWCLVSTFEHNERLVHPAATNQTSTRTQRPHLVHRPGVAPLHRVTRVIKNPKKDNPPMQVTLPLRDGKQVKAFVDPGIQNLRIHMPWIFPCRCRPLLTPAS